MRIIIITCCIISLNLINAAAQNKSKLNFDLSLTPIGYSNTVEKSEEGDKFKNKARLTYGIGVDINLIIKKETKIVFRPNISSLGYKKNIFKGRVIYAVVPTVLEFLIKEKTTTTYKMFENISAGGNHIKWVGGIGVYGASAVFGKYKYSGGSSSSYKFGESATDNRSVLDYGLVFQIGVINMNSTIKSMLQMRLGKNNVIPDSREVGMSSLKTTSVNWVISAPLSKIKK